MCNNIIPITIYIIITLLTLLFYIVQTIRYFCFRYDSLYRYLFIDRRLEGINVVTLLWITYTILTLSILIVSILTNYLKPYLC